MASHQSLAALAHSRFSPSYQHILDVINNNVKKVEFGFPPHTHADRRHLPIARVARSFSTFERHSLRRITHADRRHLPIARIARSFSTFLTLHLSISQIGPQTAEKKHLLHSSSDPWWPIRAPPGGNGNHDLPDHPPKFQPNRPTDS